MADLSIPFPGITPMVIDPKTGRLSDSWFQFFLTLWQRTGATQGDTAVPAGMLALWGGALADIPEGWYACVGETKLIIEDPQLYANIGTIWGGDGITTFGLPDFRNRTVFGAGGLFSPGDLGGNSTISLTVDQLPSHSHTVTDPGHLHDAPPAPPELPRNFVVDGVGTEYLNTGGNRGLADILLTPETQEALTGISLGNTGNGDSIDILPEYAACYVMIKR